MGRLLRLLAVTTLVLALAAGARTARAQPGERIVAYDVEIAVEASGELRIRELIDL
ncbi:MAG: hypothetical protein FJ029_13685 [Actinobacteria bacterium]|nr:hypothetical protein [Actinomycetota bacterium]